MIAQMKDWCNSILLLVSNTIAITLNGFFISRDIAALVSLVVSAVIGLLIYIVAQLVFFRWPMRSRRIRYHLDPASRFEGNWMSKVENLPGQPLNYVTIRERVGPGGAKSAPPMGRIGCF
jgi:hypothetical protein